MTVLRHDYRPPAFLADRIRLRFDLDERRTLVQAEQELRRNPAVSGSPDLVLDGEDLETLRVAVDGVELPNGAWRIVDGRLVIPGLGQRATLATTVAIDPSANTRLSGLYRSRDNLFTQCEAEGFRRITWALDRPDVLSRFQAELRGDPRRFPVLLCNGNRISSTTLPDGRQQVVWDDPFPKPCYLFALVAGELACVADAFTTRSGRTVRLEVWVEAKDTGKCQHALESLKKAMTWDEQVYGREYDLDLYMIVAVSDFNFGAMENKGLNIFNTACVLASPATSTDDDFDRVEGVVAHEYFHNWTGNRITCRDWFQLTLKEGLTVFRDQCFSEDVGKGPVKRIESVLELRNRQFSEDASPTRHPIRPDAYERIENFYTPTVYEKGAEVVRLFHGLLGPAGYRRGTDRYFQRFDGQAVTCDDFRACMAEAAGRSLDQFEQWYQQCGTPRLELTAFYDERGRNLTLTARQTPPTGTGQPPLPIPIRLGLVGPDGRDLLLDDPQGGKAGTITLLLEGSERTWTFPGLAARPVISALRGFSAPVVMNLEQTDAELAFLLAHDSDPFNRWEAGQRLAAGLLLARLAARGRGEDGPALEPLLTGFAAVLGDEGLDGTFRAYASSLPTEVELGLKQTIVDVDGLHAIRQQARQALAARHREQLLSLYTTYHQRSDQPGKAGRDARRLKNHCLGLLATLGDAGLVELAWNQQRQASCMTDELSALSVLCGWPNPQREAALDRYYRRWRHDELALDKWFSVQARSTAPDTLERILALSRHVDFSLANPNRARSLLTVLGLNQPVFHRADGAGYAFLTDQIRILDRRNPSLAARLAQALVSWRRFDPARAALMREQLRSLTIRRPSGELDEVLGRSLKDA